MKKTLIEVEVCTATQCSFIPFTAVPDDWAGRLVRIELINPSLLETDYDRGYREGYERRHMEVLGALA